MKLKNNYHAHTLWCRHAFNTAEEMILEAIKNNYQIFGISEHVGYFGKNDAGQRLHNDEVFAYISEMKALKQKYSDKITILTGFETEYLEDEKSWYEKLYQNKDVDYLILGNHFENQILDEQYYGITIKSPEKLKAYVDQAIKGMESGLFSILAHPDLFMLSYKEFDENALIQSKRLIEAAIKNNVLLEVNINGLNMVSDPNNYHSWKYPNYNFWKLFSTYNHPCIINIDAHWKEMLSNEKFQDLVFDFCKKLNLKIVDKIKLK
ncbi:histidinol-phosphatase [symbiont of Argiope bruennichi]|uniref:histidinol-phosphatase n=1 Tax=symbiont of Argiope bruennichi TaxID=2810479 RepID=UPI003DA22187